MAIKYKLVLKKDMSKDAAEDSKLWYAQGINAGEMSLEELCEDIAESSTLTSADVKAALDRLTWALNKNLRAGRIVKVGELGNFRMTFGSKGSENAEDFDISLIKKPKVTFYPGKKLQQARTEISFERIGASPLDETENDEEQPEQGIPNP